MIHFTVANVMVLAALLSAFVLVFRSGERVPAFIALAVTALEALVAFRVLTIKGPPYLGLILAVLLAIAGCWSWLRAGSKPAVTAATVVAFIGLLQLMVALKLLA